MLFWNFTASLPVWQLLLSQRFQIQYSSFNVILSPWNSRGYGTARFQSSVKHTLLFVLCFFLFLVSLEPLNLTKHRFTEMARKYHVIGKCYTHRTLLPPGKKKMSYWVKFRWPDISLLGIYYHLEVSSVSTFKKTFIRLTNYLTGLPR